MKPSETRNRIFWVRYRGEIGYMIGLVGVAFALWGQHQNTDAIRQQSQLGVQTHGAVCELRKDLKERVAGAEAFLLSHPHGFAGITAKVLEVDVGQQRKTIQALSSLRCP